MVHELRHAVDLTRGWTKAYWGQTAMEARAYAAGIVAEQELSGDSAAYFTYVGRIMGPFSNLTYAQQVRAIPLFLLDEVRH